MNIALANQNYYDKEFFNIKTFDTLITRDRTNEENNRFFEKNPSIYGIYVSSNHVNVYIILYTEALTIPSKVDIKHEENAFNNEDGIIRKYYLKPDHTDSTEILFFEKKLRRIETKLVFHSPKINTNTLHGQNRFCYDENGPVQQLSISYGFSKDHFLMKWNSIKLHDPNDNFDDDDDVFSYTYLRAPYYPKINVIFDTRISPIRYFNKEDLFRPGVPKHFNINNNNDNDMLNTYPKKPQYKVKSPKRSTNTEVYISDMDFTPIASPTRPLPKTAPPKTAPPLSEHQARPPNSSLFPKNNRSNKKQDDDPKIFT